MVKPKILFIGDYCRTDYLRMLHAAKHDCDFWFLYFATPDEERNKAYLEFGRAVYWSDYRSAQHLLDALTPFKVLFLYIDTYHAVVLNLASKNKGIPTYHLEHGMRADYSIAFNSTVSPQLNQKPFARFRNITHILYHFGDRVKARLFLKNSIWQLPDEDAAFVKEYISVRSKHNYLETFRLLPSAKRLADFYISYSPKVHQVHQQHDHLTEATKVYFIGVPYFDDLFSVAQTQPQRAILFIDQPLAEHRLLQWTPEYKKAFVAKLAEIVSEHNYKLYIKPHPEQDTSLWKHVREAELIDDSQLKQLAGSIPVVMGFYSTFLMPFAAFEHTTLITLENHPAGKLNVSGPFVAAGVAHPVYTLDDLPRALENVEQIHQQQLPHKKPFEKDWLYKFDGKAGERLRTILLSKEL